MTARRTDAVRRDADTVGRGGIVGFGNVAANGHLPGWRGRSDCRIVAVVDPDPARRVLALSLLPEAHAYDETEELLRHERLDFVDVATPPGLHAAPVIAAARAGVHVLCEKPLATSWQDYSAMRAAARHSGVVLHTVHNWKYSEAFGAVQAIVRAGTLGALQRIVFDTARNGCAAASGDNWRVRAALAGGGILVDHGWHAFYLMMALANEVPQRIRASIARRRYVDAEVEDTAACTLEFPSLTGEITLTWAAAERRTQWRLVGEDGELLLDDDRLVLRGKHAEHVQQLTTALSAGSHHPEWFAGVIDSFRHEIDDPAARGANQIEAERCLQLLCLAYASARQGALPLDVRPSDDWAGTNEAAA